MGEPATLIRDAVTDPNEAPVCPDCGSPLLPVVFGLPSRALQAQAARGEVALRGCMVPHEASRASHHCPVCAADFARRGDSIERLPTP